MRGMDKTVKVRAMPESAVQQPEKSIETAKAAGIGIKNPQAELLKKIEQLEQSLKEEQAKSAALADALKKVSDMALAAAKA